MFQRLVDLIRREPVRTLTIAAATVPIVADGLVVFNVWDPTGEQLAYVNGLPVVLGAVFGYTVVRNAVTPVDQ